MMLRVVQGEEAPLQEPTLDELRRDALVAVVRGERAKARNRLTMRVLNAGGGTRTPDTRIMIPLL